MRWADDNPELFAVMEKTRMYIFRCAFYRPFDTFSCLSVRIEQQQHWTCSISAA